MKSVDHENSKKTTVKDHKVLLNRKQQTEIHFYLFKRVCGGVFC